MSSADAPSNGEGLLGILSRSVVVAETDICESQHPEDRGVPKQQAPTSTDLARLIQHIDRLDPLFVEYVCATQPVVTHDAIGLALRPLAALHRLTAVREGGMRVSN